MLVKNMSGIAGPRMDSESDCDENVLEDTLTYSQESGEDNGPRMDSEFSVVPESSAWPILEPNEPARIIMQTQNQYKIYAVDIDAVAVAGHGECSRNFSRKTGRTQ